MTPRILVFLVLVAVGPGCSRTDQVVATACGNACGGCCDSLGRCLEGNTSQACGLEGVACMACDGPCFDGRCVGGAGGGAAATGGGAGGQGGQGGEGGAGGAGGTGGGGESDACPPDGWCVESPLPDGTRVTLEHLRGVWAASPTDVWAVGDRGTALHFDGQAWKAVPPPATDDLFAVWGTSGSDVWACGGSGWPTGPVGVIFHWDGAKWTEALRGTQRLDALWGSGPADVWAMGYGGEMARWNGAKWTVLPKVTNEAISSIHGSSPTRAWAVGSSGLVMEWNGAAWTVVPNGVFSGFAAVWAFSDTAVWAMGGNGVAQAYNGSAWQPVDLGAANTILGFWGKSPGDAWGVGPDTLLRFSGASPARKYVPTQELLLDVHGSDSHNLWAVGFKGTILRYRR